MTLNFKFGFNYKGLNFGWKDKHLYRLPSVKNSRTYPLKKLSLIEVGRKKGYRVMRDRLTVDQLMEMNEVIDYTYSVSGAGSDDCPW